MQSPVKWIIVSLGTAFTIFAGFFGFEYWIDSRIEAKLNHPATIRKIASLVRPSITFDHHGSILTDSGAGQFIKNIKVTMGKNEPKNILITPTKHLNTPPILEGINYNFHVTAKRIGKSDWLFELSSPNYVVFGGGEITKEWIFRLEIIL